MKSIGDDFYCRSRLTISNQTIDHSRKLTFDGFIKAVWVSSRTNLHYIDFKYLFEDDLKLMFKPVKVVLE